MASTGSELNLVHLSPQREPTPWYRRKRFIFLAIFIAFVVMLAIAVPASRSSSSNSNTKSRTVVVGDSNPRSAFIGKPRAGSDFIGKPRAGSDFIGKPRAGSAGLRKASAGSVVMGDSNWSSNYIGAKVPVAYNPDPTKQVHTSPCDMSAVVISEVSAGDHGYWVELQNTGTGCMVDLSQYVLQLEGRDKHAKFSKECKNNILNSEKYITLHSDEKSECGLPWKLDPVAGSLSLLRRGLVIERVQWENLPHSKALARNTAGKHLLTQDATEGMANKFV